MSCGKYSPTVEGSYFVDQGWWEKHCIDPDHDLYDADGFDPYGYNEKGIDREGYSEEDYLGSGEWIDGEYVYTLYEQVSIEWLGRAVF